jgi:tetratricopeptide (TPR) repeat protein
MARILGVVLLAGLTASAALADVLVVKKGRNPKVLGLPDEIDGVEVTPDNWRIYLPQSEGVILEENYDSVVWKRNEKTRRTETYPIAEVVEVGLNEIKRDEALEAGYRAVANRNLAGAIQNFKDCVQNEEARPVDRAEANFRIGFTYAAFSRLPLAQKHFETWSGGKSKWTPEAYRLLAEILTGRQKYGEARATYQKIIALPDIPEAWKIKAEAGLVKVDIAERKYGDAEKKAAAIAKKAEGDEALTDGRAFAMGLQAQAIVNAQDEARLAEAEKLLQAAVELKGLSNTTLAFLYSTLGDAMYAQKRLAEARFPYLRVVELYPEESGYVANSLLNAGNCFIDMAGAAQNDGKPKLHDEYLIKGMLLISECGTKYKGTGAARQASAVWRRNKSEYEAAKTRTGK